jgi:hypothetical protein
MIGVFIGRILAQMGFIRLVFTHPIFVRISELSGH